MGVLEDFVLYKNTNQDCLHLIQRYFVFFSLKNVFRQRFKQQPTSILHLNKKNYVFRLDIYIFQNVLIN